MKKIILFLSLILPFSLFAQNSSYFQKGDTISFGATTGKTSFNSPKIWFPGLGGSANQVFYKKTDGSFGLKTLPDFLINNQNGSSYGSNRITFTDSLQLINFLKVDAGQSSGNVNIMFTVQSFNGTSANYSFFGNGNTINKPDYQFWTELKPDKSFNYYGLTDNPPYFYPFEKRYTRVDFRVISESSVLKYQFRVKNFNVSQTTAINYLIVGSANGLNADNTVSAPYADPYQPSIYLQKNLLTTYRQSQIIPNQAIDQNGNLGTYSHWINFKPIPVNHDSTYVFETNGQKIPPLDVRVRFEDVNHNLIAFNQAQTIPFIFKAPSNCEFVVLPAQGHAENVDASKLTLSPFTQVKYQKQTIGILGDSFGADPFNIYQQALKDRLSVNLIVDAVPGSCVTGGTNYAEKNYNPNDNTNRVPMVDRIDRLITNTDTSDHVNWGARPQIIMVEGGANDFIYGINIGASTDIASRNKNTFYGALSYIAYQATHSDHPVKLVFVAPMFRGDTQRFSGGSAGGQANAPILANYTNAMLEVANYYGIGFIDQSKNGINFGNVSLYTVDGAHPNGNGKPVYNNFLIDNFNVNYTVPKNAETWNYNKFSFNAANVVNGFMAYGDDYFWHYVNNAQSAAAIKPFLGYGTAANNNAGDFLAVNGTAVNSTKWNNQTYTGTTTTFGLFDYALVRLTNQNIESLVAPLDFRKWLNYTTTTPGMTVDNTAGTINYVLKTYATEFNANLTIASPFPVQNYEYIGTGGNTLTLSPMSSSYNYEELGFTVKHSGSGNLTITGLIDGNTTTSITLTAKQAVHFVPNGTQWNIYSSYGF